MDQKVLKKLLNILKDAGVQSYKDQTFEVSFYKTHLSTQSTIQDVDESSLPVDLRAENINSDEFVRNWSSSPDDHMGEAMPATGDLPLA